MERDIEAPLAAALGGASALTTTLLTSRVGVEGVEGGAPNVWNGIIGKVSGYSNAKVRRVGQLLIVIKLCFLVALESRDDLLHWNSAVLICVGWHLYCLLASEALARSVGRERLNNIASTRMLGVAISNCLLFLVYLVTFWMTHPDARQLGFNHLPLGILIQVYPFPTSSIISLIWGVTLAFVRIPMMLTWSLSLHLLASKVFGALSKPDPRMYQTPDAHQVSPRREQSQDAHHLSPRREQSQDAYQLSPRSTGSGGSRRRSVELTLAQEFKQHVQSSELKFRFRHFCELAERLKAVGQEVDLLATVVWCGQVMWAVLALNCLVLGDPFSMGPFLIFYVFVMVVYVLYMLYSFWMLVSVIYMMQSDFVSVVDKDLLSLDLDKQMELVRDNLQIRQVVLDTQLGVSIFRGSILVNSSTMVRMLAFFVSVFFVLIKIKRGQDA